MCENIFIMRHFKDEDNLFEANDNPILNSELLKVGILAEIITSEAFKSNINHAYFFTSNKKRAIITAREIAKKIENVLPATIEIDPRIREIDQGNYILPPTYNPGDFYSPLAKAWGVYFAETFENKNITYRFGDPLGGHIDNDETWQEALKREAREEAGVTIINILVIGYIFIEHIARKTDLRYPSKAIIPITFSKILDYSSKWERKETKKRKLFSVENAQRVLKKRKDNNQMLEIFNHIIVNYLK